MLRVLPLLTVLLAVDPAAADPANRLEHLRPMQPWIAAALERGMRESPTMARIVGDIETAPLIVHILGADGARQGWDGRIQFVSESAGWLYVRIEVRQHGLPMTAALIAHELQHALEMAAGGVDDVAAFRDLYRRIGLRKPTTAEQYDTPAAVAAGERTLYEIRAAALAPWARRSAGLRACRLTRCTSR